MPADPYIDPVTGILRNNLRLGTTAELDAAEREITHAALISLRESPAQATYDLAHLCAIHRGIFGEIYDWAGQVRTVAIAKGAMFCLPQFIEPAAAEISSQLRQEGLLRRLGRDAFVDRLTYYLGEVNAVHPFREGNGRTQRAFFEQLAADAGYRLGWHHLDAERNIIASEAIMRGNPDLMRKMLDELIDGHQPDLPGEFWCSGDHTNGRLPAHRTSLVPVGRGCRASLDR
jgi:cell filamentation protein